jgi:Zn-dependent oligopeptidase
VAELTARYTVLPVEDGAQWHGSLRHLASYGAGYYTYLWAKSLSRLVWRRCFAADPLSRIAGEQWCQNVLRHGGAREPRGMLRHMMANAHAPPQREHARSNHILKEGPQTEHAPESLESAEAALFELVDLSKDASSLHRG